MNKLTASAGGNTVATQWNKLVRTNNGILVGNKHNYPSYDAHKASIEYAKCVAEAIFSITQRKFLVKE